jgi:hypothetical protein
MGIFPYRWQKALFAIMVIGGMIAKIELNINQGIWYTLASLLFMSAMAVIVVVSLAIVIDMVQEAREKAQAEV